MVNDAVAIILFNDVGNSIPNKLDFSIK